MAKENLKEMMNRVNLQGTLVNNSVEMKVDKNGRRYISGQLEIMVDKEYIIPVSAFTYEFKQNGEKNPMFERLSKVVDLPSARTAGMSGAAHISVTSARFEDNSFFSDRDNRVVSNWRIGGSLIRTVAEDAAPINSFEVQGVVSSIKEVVDREGNNTDTYDLKLLNVAYGNRINELTFRFDDPAAIKYINDNYNVGDTVTVCGQVVYEQHQRTVEKEYGFGEAAVQTYVNTVRLLRITAGTPPVDPDESGYQLKELQQLLAAQQEDIVEKHNARAQVTTANNKNSGLDLLF